MDIIYYIYLPNVGKYILSKYVPCKSLNKYLTDLNSLVDSEMEINDIGIKQA